MHGKNHIKKIFRFIYTELQVQTNTAVLNVFHQTERKPS